jgi:hypothetical protein
MKRFGWLTGLAILIAVSVFANEAEQDRLNAARALWAAAHDGNYRYSYQKFCECYPGEPPVTVVTVTDGAIERVFHRHGDSEREVPARDGSYSLYWTVDELFDKLAGAYDTDAVVRAEFDADTGFPVTLYIDYDPGFVGDETDLRLTGVEILR